MKTAPSIPSSCSTHPHSAHCTNKSRSGRRCRFSVADPASSLCFKHAARRRTDHALADFASTLTRQSEEFQTAAGINQSLAELYRLLAQDRITPRRAAVLAYISNLLLRTLTAMDREANPPYDESNPPQSDFTGIPRPSQNEPP